MRAFLLLCVLIALLADATTCTATSDVTRICLLELYT
jgi:hypothetical protein